ncbi:MAG: hypothetical protein EXR27_19730 [Betaproteobacteria bacterium]|nr:hypothetical protein [Betaproteobacteria bacterium]
MTTRRALLASLGLCALSSQFGACAQQPDKIRRIGFLGTRSRSMPSIPGAVENIFVQGMRDLGYVDGKNIIIEWRFADYKFERLASLAAELVRLNPEVIVTHATPAVQALHLATRTIPIVSASMGDPIASGFAASLGRPGGNITGLSIMSTDVSPKQIELLKTMVPALSHVAFL